MANIRLNIKNNEAKDLEEKKQVFELVISNKDNVEFLRHLYGQYNYTINYFRDTKSYDFLPKLEKINATGNPIITINLFDTKPEEQVYSKIVNKMTKKVIDYNDMGEKPKTYPSFSKVLNIPKLKDAVSENKNEDSFLNKNEKNESDKIKDFEKVVDIIHAKYGLEIEDKKRIWFYSDSLTIHRLVEKEHILVHEVLKNNTRFFVDLDDKENRISNFWDAAKTIVNEFGRFFKQYYSKFQNKEHEDVLSVGHWFCCYMTRNTSKQFGSAHLFFDIYDNSNKSIITRTAQQQAKFWKKFGEYLDFTYNTDVFDYVMDKTPYRYNAQLRMPFAEKNGTFHTYVFTKGMNYNVVNEVQVSNQTALHLCRCPFENCSCELNFPINGKIVFYDNGFRTLETEKPVKGKLHPIYHTELKVEKVCEPRYYDYLVSRGDNEKYIYPEEEESTTSKPVENTTYAIRLFKDYLKNTKIDISKFSVWSRTIYMIWCFYWNYPLTKRVNTVINFCKSRGWGTQENNMENIKCCFEWALSKKHHNFSFLAIKKHFQMDGDFMNVHMPIINYSELEQETFKFNEQERIRVEAINKQIAHDNKKLNKHQRDYISFNPISNRIMAIKSGCSTHKTSSLFKEYGHLKLLFITFRRSLAAEIVTKYKKYGIQHYKDDEIDGSCSAVIQLESLYKFINLIQEFDIIVFDESELICSEFKFAHKTNSNSFPILESAMRYIFEKKRIILMSANLGEQTRHLLQCFGVEKETAFFKNTYAKQKDLKYEILDDKKAFITKVLELLQFGKKLIIPINSVRFSTAVQEKQKKKEREAELLAKELGREIIKTDKKILMVNSYTKPTPVSEWINYDAVIYTNTICAGNSIDYEHFNTVCAFFFNRAGTYDACFQMLFRLRNILDKKIYISICDYTVSEKGTRVDRLRKKDIGDKQYAQSLANEKIYSNTDIAACLNYTDKDFSLDDYSSPLYKVVLFYGHYERYSRYNFRQLLINEFQEIGMIEDEGIKRGDNELEEIDDNGTNKNLWKSIRDRYEYLQQLKRNEEELSQVQIELGFHETEELLDKQEELKLKVIDHEECFGGSAIDYGFKINHIIEDIDKAEEILSKDTKIDDPILVNIDERIDRTYNWCQIMKGNFHLVTDFNQPIFELARHIGEDINSSRGIVELIKDFIKIKGDVVFATKENARKHTAKKVLAMKNNANLIRLINKYLKNINYKIEYRTDYCRMKILDTELLAISKQEYIDFMSKSIKDVLTPEEISDMPN